MKRLLIFAAILLLSVSGCATSISMTDSREGPPLNAVLEVSSEPSGAAVAVMVDNLDPKTREQTPYIKTGKQGITPCQLDIEQGKIGRYFIEFIKEDCKTEICKITAEVVVTHPDHTAGKTVGKIGDVLMSPALSIIGAAMQSSGPSRSFKLSPNPLHVVLKPIVKTHSNNESR